jgi:hypothetical protein
MAQVLESVHPCEWGLEWGLEFEVFAKWEAVGSLELQLGAGLAVGVHNVLHTLDETFSLLGH